MTNMTVNGVTTTQACGQEQHEYYMSGTGRRRKRRCSYDYRHTDGELFSCTKSNLEECKAAKDAWLKTKEVA